MSSFLEHYDALNLMGEKLAPHVEDYVAQNASMSDIIKMLLTESQKISLEELCNELGLPVPHDEGDVKNGKRQRKQTKKAKESQEQDVNDENVTKENERVKVGGKFKCRKKSVPSDKVLKENAQNHAAVAGCLNMLQEANLCKFQTAFSDQVKLNPETHTTSLSGDFANHTISSLIPIDAPKAISYIMTTTTE